VCAGKTSTDFLRSSFFSQFMEVDEGEEEKDRRKIEEKMARV
jgi:hypothetical protein